MDAIKEFDVMDAKMLETVTGGSFLGCILGTAGMTGVGFMTAGPAGAAALGGATAIRVCR